MWGWSSAATASASRWNRRICRSAARAGLDHLERDDPVEPLLPGLEDDPHASLGQLLEQHVIAQDGPWLHGHAPPLPAEPPSASPRRSCWQHRWTGRVVVGPRCG